MPTVNSDNNTKQVTMNFILKQIEKIQNLKQKQCCQHAEKVILHASIDIVFRLVSKMRRQNKIFVLQQFLIKTKNLTHSIQIVKGIEHVAVAGEYGCSQILIYNSV